MNVLIRAGGIRKNRCDYEAPVFGMFATTVLADLTTQRRYLDDNSCSDVTHWFGRTRVTRPDM